MLQMILGALLLCAAAFAGLCFAVCICAKLPRRAGKADCLLVLGAGVHPDGSLKNTLRKRCDAAKIAWKRGIAGDIILCGGQGRREPCTEASAMALYLKERGVPANVLWEEGNSANTAENLRNAREMMRMYGWKTAAIVTSDYHMQRSLWLARDLGISARGITCGSPDQASNWVKSRVKEALSWILYMVRKI